MPVAADREAYRSAIAPQPLRRVMAMLRWCAASAGGLMFAPLAMAGPWEVGGTGIDSKRKFKAEVMLRQGGGESHWARPVLGYAFPVSDRVSMEIATGYGIVDSAVDRRSGRRDVDIKAKVALASSNDGRVAWLIEPKLAVPLGDERSGMGRGRYAAELPLRVSYTRSALTYTAEVKYSQVLVGQPADRLVGAGALLEYSPDPRWVIGMDVYADASTQQMSATHTRASFGGKWRPTTAWELQGLLGRSLHNQRGSDTTTYKVVLEYKF